MLNRLQYYKVTSLTIQIPQGDHLLLELPNFGLFLPNIRHFNLISKTKKSVILSSTNSFRDLKHLETLQIANINFEFDSLTVKIFLKNLIIQNLGISMD